MWYAAKQTVAPSGEPVTVADVKAHTYIDHTDDDNEIAMLVDAARDHVERYCNLRIATQTVDVKCDSFDDFLYLPFGPVQSITNIKYIGTDGVERTLDSSIYELRADDLDASIMRQYGMSWPPRRSGTRITVTAIVGFAAVPPAIKHAVLLMVAAGFKDREAQGMVATSTADALLSNFRRGA